MKRTRVWTGLAVILTVTAALVIAVILDELYRYGQIQGTVYYKGRPLPGGMIFFESDPFGSALGTFARIDDQGNFACEPDWQRDRSGRARYRIYVMLDEPANGPIAPIPSEAGDIRMETLAKPREPGRDQEGRLLSQVVPASLGSPGPSTGGPASGSSPGGSGRRTLETGPSLVLGPGPAHLEINLKD